MSIDAPPEANGAQAPRALPRASRERWQPLRSGLLNLYRYDGEEFWFDQGRLLLRGNNGTGKSRVLALQLPFLLDGEVASHRLEPDGDPAKRIEWNLLMGKHRDRLGYTWLELGRVDAGGDEHYLTIGCGLHAVEGRGLASRWFFITRQRIGADLSLLAPAGHAVNREQLTERIGAAGNVFTAAAPYRAAVNAALFRLSEHQYAALMGLLIQLRKPQLSRQLDEKALSSALGEALRPMPAAVIADVAEAFRSLESDRSTLDAFVAARAGADRFLTEYRRYAQIVARRLAEVVRSAHASYEKTMRRLREAEGDRDAAVREHAAAVAALAQLEIAQTAAVAEVETLRESPQMKSVRDLDAARRMAEERATSAERARSQHDRAVADYDALGNEQARAEQRAAAAREDVATEAQTARNAAAIVGLEGDHEDIVIRLASADEGVESAKQALGRLIGRRQSASRHVRELEAALSESRAAYDRARATHAERTARLDTAIDTHRGAAETHAAESRRLIDGFRAWAASLTELAVHDVDEIADAIAEWCQHAESRSPLATVVAVGAADAAGRFAALRADAQQRVKSVGDQLGVLSAEQEQLLSGRHRPPPTPHTRDVVTREERAGAPLWRLCEFRPEVSAGARAGFEAALEASGLLDAWVLPDGRVLSPIEHDTVIIGGEDAPSSSGARASDILQPAIDHADERASLVADAVVARALARIGLGAGSGDVWIDDSGAWRVGMLTGRWRKDAAEHIGESARDAARRARLVAVAAEIMRLEDEKTAIERELATIMRRERTMRSESEAAPDDGGVRAALASVATEARNVAALRTEVARLEAETIERHRDMTARTGDRDAAAADLGLAAWVDRLNDYDQALAEYRIVCGASFAASIRCAELEDAAAAAHARFQTGAEAAHRAFVAAGEAERAAAESAAVYETLKQAIGSAVEEILERLAAAERARKSIAERVNAARTAESDWRVRLETAGVAIGAHTETLERDAAERQAAIARLEAFAGTRLLALCDASLGDVELAGWSVTRAVDIARRIEGVLSGERADDAAWDRSRRHIHAHLQTLTDTLQPHGYDPAAESDGDVLIVTASFQGKRCTVAELRAGLEEEVVSRQALLDAREIEILENHLVGEVSQHLHDLLREGETWVDNMNRELSDRPMSTGMRLKFRWEPAEDGPDDFPEMRRRLLRAGATWSSDERRTVGAFLQRRIQSARAANEGGSWVELLTAAIDYRAWHRFSIERQQDGQWKRLTRRTHGTGSGGEKAIALTIPQFAAAAAHYRSADPAAPRLILLDEAFVGIDSDMRSKCVGLLAVFDLDFMMTSEREWACYATLPGVAIYQLATRPGIDAVGLTRWVWNGRQRVRDDHPPPALAPPRAMMSDDQPAFEWPT